MFRLGLFGSSSNMDAEVLDSPLTNFDIINVPTKRWSSSLFSCHKNLVPSCVLAFFCPCILFAQVVVRAQIPLLIALKNSIIFFRRQSGYGVFVDYFMFSLLISIALICVLSLVHFRNMAGVYLLSIIVIVLLGSLIYLLGHVRMAFKEKYELPGALPDGCHFWEMLLDMWIAVCCLPCSLAQMARHVFQYPVISPPLGLFLGDPSSLPPLGSGADQVAAVDAAGARRPPRADTAGLIWTVDGRHPNARDNSGAAHRQEELRWRQEQQIIQAHAIAQSSAPPAEVQPKHIYNADGTHAEP
eukprot:gene25319-33850_t